MKASFSTNSPSVCWPRGHITTVAYDVQEVHDRLTQPDDEQLPDLCMLFDRAGTTVKMGMFPRQVPPSMFSTTQHQPPHLCIIFDLDYNMILAFSYQTLAVLNQNNTGPVFSVQSALT